MEHLPGGSELSDQLSKMLQLAQTQENGARWYFYKLGVGQYEILTNSNKQKKYPTITQY